MFRLPSLSWTSFGADKVTPESVKYANPKPRKMTSTDTGKMQKLKRKRAESGGSDTSTQQPPAKKIDQQPRVVIPRPVPPEDLAVMKASEVRNPEPPTPSPTNDGNSPKEQNSPLSSARSADGPTPLTEKQLDLFRHTIKSQFSLEILMKHNELRLIDQEMAKCQIALEQLRRCKEIPYPGYRLSEDVSNGTGPALRSNTLVPAEMPPPWGVVDGPYSRHYAKWLLPDPKFDGSNTLPQPVHVPAGKAPAKGRSTRGSFTEPDVGGRNGRRGAKGFGMQSLPSGYPAPRDKAGPMIQKRKSDGMVVKLVCLDCRRDNFSSAQGFINHCRIAHNRSFASHDAAADACGEPVEVDETGAVVGGEIPAAGAAGLVHPLIRSAHLLKKDAAPTNEGNQPTTAISASKSGNEVPMNSSERAPALHTPTAATSRLKRGRKAKETEASPSTFKPSPLTPHLSELMLARGSSLDLYDIVGDARAPMDIHEASSEESDSSDEEESSTPPPTPGRLPVRGAGMQPVHSTVGSHNISPADNRIKLEKEHRPRRLENIPSNVHAPPTSAFTASQPDVSTDLMDVEPSPTNDSNQAPSLVDDDEEYEEHSSSETSSTSSGSHVELDVEVEDDESTNGAPSTRSSGEDSEFSGTAKQAQSSQPRQASALRRGLARREEKHVTFVSPSPVREVVKKRGGRRKKTE